MTHRAHPGQLRRTFKLGAAGAPLACAFALLTATGPAWSQVDPEVVYRSAVDDLKAGRYAEACPKFAEARRLKSDSVPALQGLAQCYDKAGKTASAWAKYRQLSVELKQSGDAARAELASNRAEELGRSLSTLEIKPESADTPGLVIRLDKEEVPRAMFGTRMNVDPGQHILEATAPGFEVWSTTVTIGASNDAKQTKVPPLVAKPARRWRSRGDGRQHGAPLRRLRRGRAGRGRPGGGRRLRRPRHERGQHRQERPAPATRARRRRRRAICRRPTARRSSPPSASARARACSPRASSCMSSRARLPGGTRGRRSSSPRST